MSSKSFEIGFSNISPMFHQDTEQELSNAWEERSRELLKKQLQDHADVLYLDLASDFLGKRKEFATKMLERIRTADSPRELSIPLYMFNVCRTASGNIPYTAYDKGWHSTLVATQRDDDGYEHTVLTRQSLLRIFLNSDVCDRLALLWGGREFTISVQRTGRSVAEEPELIVHEYALTLHYWPRGLPPNKLLQLKNVQETYLCHSPFYPVGLTTIYNKVPACPVTPPRLASSVSPPGAPVRPRPQLATRTNGGGIPFPSVFE